jgi:hypothetical protein
MGASSSGMPPGAVIGLIVIGYVLVASVVGRIYFRRRHGGGLDGRNSAAACTAAAVGVGLIWPAMPFVARLRTPALCRHPRHDQPTPAQEQHARVLAWALQVTERDRARREGRRP